MNKTDVVKLVMETRGDMVSKPMEVTLDVRLIIDGDKWLAFYPQDCFPTAVCGSGDSPAEALQDFRYEFNPWFYKEVYQ